MYNASTTRINKEKTLKSSARSFWFSTGLIEDIYFFEVNTKYIPSSVLTASYLTRVRSTSENFVGFNSRDDIYLVFTEKSKFSFYFTFVLLRRFLVNQLTMLQTESQLYKTRQRSICDRISGLIHSHRDLQMK